MLFARRTLSLPAALTPVLLGSLAMTSGCTRDVTSPPSLEVRSARAVQRYSGEEIFRGVVFGAGRVGALFPEMWEGRSAEARATTAQQLAEVRRVEGEVIARIQREDPTFFSRFGAGMQSGDRVRIAEVMDDAAKRVSVVLPAVAQTHKGGGGVSVECLFVEVAVAIYIAAVLAVALFWVAEQPTLSPSLQREQSVDWVAQRLTTAPAL